MRHQVARGGALEIRKGEPLEMLQEDVAKIELHVAGNDDDCLAGEEREAPAISENVTTNPARPSKPEVSMVRFRVLFQDVDRTTDEHGLSNRKRLLSITS